jgi:ADP-heptose:LPS heptosyltransferase
MKNAILKTCVTLFKSKRKTFKQERFLIVSTTALGDTLWATPALRSLRAGHKDAYIGVLTSPIGNEVLLHNPHIDTLFVLKGAALSSLCSLYTSLKREAFSHIILFHTSQRPVLPFLALLSPKALIGSTGMSKGLDSLLTHSIAQDPLAHEIERRLALVKTVGGVEDSKEIELFLSQSDQLLADVPTGRPLIALHPGAKDGFKQWPPSHFIELGKRLQQTLGASILVTGTPGEQLLVEKIAAQIPLARSITHLPLRAFAALLKKVDLMISNDTGAMHVAFAMHTPTIALFTPTNPLHCGPLAAKRAFAIAKAPTCTPCLKKKCAAAFCLLQIGIEEVYHAAVDYIKHAK